MITSKRGLDLARLHVSEFDERTEVVTAEGNTRDNAMKNLETKIKCIGLVKGDHYLTSCYHKMFR